MSKNQPTVVLNMIVKDESANIEGCLTSVLPFIDHWVIVDTGSSDDTRERIQKYFQTHGTPGRLYDREWVDFAHNRNEALNLAREAADYVLIMDADDRLFCGDGFTWPTTGADAYGVLLCRGTAYYRNLRFVKTAAPFRWHGVVHETLVSDVETVIDSLGSNCYVESGQRGARSRDPFTYERDAALLQVEVEKDPTDSRSWFYLAQSYRDAGKLKKAIFAYMKRLELGGWPEELYCTLLELGRVQMKLEQPWAVPLHSLLSAYDLRPGRIESMYEVVKRCRIHEQFALGYALAQVPSKVRHTDDWLFVEMDVFQWRMLEEQALCAMGLGLWSAAHDIFQQLKEEGLLPTSEEASVQANLDLCEQKLNPEGSM